MGKEEEPAEDLPVVVCRVNRVNRFVPGIAGNLAQAFKKTWGRRRGVKGLLCHDTGTDHDGGRRATGAAALAGVAAGVIGVLGAWQDQKRRTCRGEKGGRKGPTKDVERRRRPKWVEGGKDVGGGQINRTENITGRAAWSESDAATVDGGFWRVKMAFAQLNGARCVGEKRNGRIRHLQQGTGTESARSDQEQEASSA